MSSGSGRGRPRCVFAGSDHGPNVEAALDIVAAARALRKALDLDVLPGRLLCVDWLPPRGVLDDQLVFVFDGGMLDDQSAAVVRPYGTGVAACRFVKTANASSLLDPDVWLRVQHGISAFMSGTTAYLHYGLRLSGAPSDIGT